MVVTKRVITTTHPDGTRVVVEEYDDDGDDWFGQVLTAGFIVLLGLLLLVLLGWVDFDRLGQLKQGSVFSTVLASSDFVKIDLNVANQILPRYQSAGLSKVIYRATGEPLPQLGDIFRCAGSRVGSVKSVDKTPGSTWGVHGNTNYYAEGRVPDDRWYGQDLVPKCNDWAVLLPMDAEVTPTAASAGDYQWGNGCIIRGVGVYKDFFMKIIHTTACEVQGKVSRGTRIASVSTIFNHIHVITEYRTYDVPYTVLTVGGDFQVSHNNSYKSSVADEMILEYFVMPDS